MNTQAKSAPTLPGATGPSAHKTQLALLGGGVVLVVALGAGVYARSNGDSAAPPAASVPAPVAHEGGPAAEVARPRTERVYLVASDEQAAFAWAGISEANAILASLGEPPFDHSVALVPSDVQAREVTDAVAEGNRVALSLGLAEKTLVDLR